VYFLPIATDHVENYLKKESTNIISSLPINRFPGGTSIVMIASRQVDYWFNMNGKGLEEYTGWYICDGRNGTPDLRGRFVVERDVLSSNSSYPNISMTGGLDKVTLTVDEMPIHSHTFEADTSNNRACQIERTTEATGNRNHHLSGTTRSIGGNKPQDNHQKR